MRILFLINFSHGYITRPLVRWKKQLVANGFRFTVKPCLPKNIEAYDAVIMSNAFLVQEFKKSAGGQSTPIDLGKRFADEWHRLGKKVYFFDARDGAPSNYFDLLPYVDGFLKKQHLVNKERYASRDYAENSSGWLDSRNKKALTLARADQLYKIRAAWNIGFEDFSVHRKPRKVLTWFGKTYAEKFNPPESNRRYLTTFRGSFGGSRKGHRERAVEQLQKMDNPAIKLGPPIKRRSYLKELKACQIVVSPFGYGEVCYRDFEGILAGAALVKPDMGHLVTFPDIYSAGSTYLSVEWDFSDLREKLDYFAENSDHRFKIASAAQVAYKDALSDAKGFVEHIQDILTTKSSA